MGLEGDGKYLMTYFVGSVSPAITVLRGELKEFLATVVVTN